MSVRVRCAPATAIVVVLSLWAQALHCFPYGLGVMEVASTMDAVWELVADGSNDTLLYVGIVSAVTTTLCHMA